MQTPYGLIGFSLSNCVRDKLICILTALKTNIRDIAVDEIQMSEEENGAMIKFIDIILDHVKDMKDDMSDYSKAKMNIVMDMNGFDYDTRNSFMWKLRDICVNNRIGMLNIKKPVELSNCIISLLEI